MTRLKENLLVLGFAAVAMLTAYGLERGLVLNSAPPVLPMGAKLGFVLALVLFGARFLKLSASLGDGSRKSLILRAVVFAVPWYLWMILVTNVPLPGPEALPQMIGAVFFGGFMAFLTRKTGKTGAPPLGRLQIGLIIALAIVTVALSLQPYYDDTRWVIFVLLLALNVAAPGAERWSDIRWHDWAMALLATAGLLAGLWWPGPA